MERHMINDMIRTYVFEDTIVITALINQQKAILIDCGMVEHAEQVKMELDNEGIIVNAIIFTHYHPDHVAGSDVFGKVDLICSSRYEENYKYFSEHNEEHIVLHEPTRLIDEGCFELNGFEIKIFNGEGHCWCGSLILINNDTLCAGDLMMQSLDDEPCIPSLCSDGSIQKHKTSLEKIINLEPKNLIIGHGRPIKSKEHVIYAVNERLYYLNKFIESDGNSLIEDCILGDVNKWVLQRAHDSNILVYKGEA